MLSIAMLIEGPTITTVAAFAARLGYFNIWLVFLISILGNFIPDVAYYALGRWGRRSIDRHPAFFAKLGISERMMAKAEKLLRSHPFMTLLISKLVPILGLSGLTAAGAVKMPLKEYSFWSLAIILVTSGTFLGIGYYLGEAYIRLAVYQEYALAIIGVSIFLIIYGYGKLKTWWGGKLASKELD